MASLARRMTAWSSLAALLVGLGMPMLPGLHAAATAQDDCAGPTRRPGDLRVQVSAPADSTAPDHCVMCHWLRSVRSASIHPPIATDPGLTVRTIDASPSIRAASRLIVLEGPSRAPPLTS